MVTCCQSAQNKTEPKTSDPSTKMEQITAKPIKVGAEQLDKYLPKLEGKTIAIVVNQTSKIGDHHLIDQLLEKKVKVTKIFAPEHGFRGAADAGEKVKDGKDAKTGLPIISLYGKNKKPSKEMLKGIDFMVFDIQDVGARFYTYISTMSLVMEACAENGIPLLILDRPNPNGHIVDGPVLEEGFESFVGMHRVPILHGMTMAEYAHMLNGEKWLKGGIQCKLHYVLCENYTHNTPYQIPVKPSPNLPNWRSILLYPHLCLLEGTPISVGRGTDKQFQVIGHPDIKSTNGFTFTPTPKPGAKYPKHQDKLCNGIDLSKLSLDQLQKIDQFDLTYILEVYTDFKDKKSFFNKNNFFDRLAGTDQLRKQIQAGKTEKEIRSSWQRDLAEFKQRRFKYLLYK